MGGILVVGEIGPDGALTKLSTEVGTLARELGAVAGLEVVASLSPGAGDAAATLAGATGGRVVRCTVANVHEVQPPATAMVHDALSLAADADWIVLPATPNGRDAAGALSALLGIGVIGNATGVRWEDGGPIVTTSAFGGKLVIQSGFTGGRGIVTIRPNAVTASTTTPGPIEDATGDPSVSLPDVDVVGHEAAAGAAVSIDDARIIVAGGRGVGGPDGFALLQDLADELGGAVGATRAAVDSGWIAYSQQIGQTGKIVKPQLYLALGISGAIQHKVGMQTAESIVAINRDPDAPLASFADVYVVGDLVEVGHALLDELRQRRG